jgi:hypothetical protein
MVWTYRSFCCRFGGFPCCGLYVSLALTYSLKEVRGKHTAAVVTAGVATVCYKLVQSYVLFLMRNLRLLMPRPRSFMLEVDQWMVVVECKLTAADAFAAFAAWNLVSLNLSKSVTKYSRRRHQLSLLEQQPKLELDLL